MANKKPKYKKITPQLKDKIYSPQGKSPTLTTCGGGHREPKVRVLYVQGDIDPQGFRRLSTIEELADDNKLSKNTLYKMAQRENWKFQQERFSKRKLEVSAREIPKRI